MTAANLITKEKKERKIEAPFILGFLPFLICEFIVGTFFSGLIFPPLMSNYNNLCPATVSLSTPYASAVGGCTEGTAIDVSVFGILLLAIILGLSYILKNKLHYRNTMQFLIAGIVGIVVGALGGIMVAATLSYLGWLFASP